MMMMMIFMMINVNTNLKQGKGRVNVRIRGNLGEWYDTGWCSITNHENLCNKVLLFNISGQDWTYYHSCTLTSLRFVSKELHYLLLNKTTMFYKVTIITKLHSNWSYTSVIGAYHTYLTAVVQYIISGYTEKAECSISPGMVMQTLHESHIITDLSVWRYVIFNLGQIFLWDSHTVKKTIF